MAIASSSLAFKRAALMTATKVTSKPPSPEVLRARDDFKDFCVYMGKAPAHHMMEWHSEPVSYTHLTLPTTPYV